MSLTNTLTGIFTGIAGEMWSIFLDAAPYLFLGFGIAGLLHIWQYERSPAAIGENDLCGVDAPDDGVCNLSLDAHNPFKMILTVVKKPNI